MPDENKISALISLLDDSDSEIFDHVSHELISYGANIIPTLEQYWEHTPNHLLQERLEQVIHCIHFEKNLADMRNWSAREDNDLLKGLLLLSKYQYPELDTESILDTIYKLRRDIWIELNDSLTPMEQVNILNQLFFRHYSITDDEKSLDPNAYFLNIILESRRGNATAITAFYIALAQMMNIPVFGFPFPFHFCAAMIKDTVAWDPGYDFNESDVILYINIMSQGQIMTRNELYSFSEKLAEDIRRTLYIPKSNRKYLRHIIMQLKEAYARNNATEKVKEMEAFIDALRRK